MTEVVILPGLDGTTLLLEPFLACLSRLGIAARAIAYPADAPLGYDGLEEFVRPRLPSGTPFVLLGESFSGPLAIRIAAEPPPALRGLVLSTTFARNPVPALRPVAGLTRFAPAHPPMPCLSWWLLGRWATPELQSDLRSALRVVNPVVTRARAAAALCVDASTLLPMIRVPTLNLVASHDRLLGRAAAAALANGLPNSRRVSIPGPHLLLQVAVEACAKEVADFVCALER